MENVALFGASMVMLLLMPGPTNTLLATSGATVGFRRSAPLLLGEIVGYTCSILVLALVLGPALSSAHLTASILRVAAGIYLMYQAIRLWTTPLRFERAIISARQVLVTTLFNPKALVFALVIIPFGSRGAKWYFLAFLVTVPAIGTLWIGAGSLLRRHAPPRYATSFPKVASIALAIMSATLVCSALFTQPTAVSP